MNTVTEKPRLVQDVATTKRSSARGTRAPRLAIAAVVLLGTAIGAGWWYGEGRWIETTDNAYVRGDIAVLSTRIAGEVLAVRVADNQRVRAGDPLIELDPTDWQARLTQAKATVTEAEASAMFARRQHEQQRSAIVSAQAMIAQAEAEQTRATADATRSSTLAASGWASRQADDLAVATSRKAVAALTAAVAQKSATEQQLTVIGAQVAQADARLAAAIATVRLAENNLSYTVIKAPFDGIVGNRAAEPGQYVAPGSQIIALTPPPERLYVVANFKETQLRHMRPGMKARLIPDIDPSAAVDGLVDSLAPATGALFSLLPPENATGNFTKVVQRVPVKIVIDPNQSAGAHWLRAGLSVTTEVDTRADGIRRGVFGAAWETLRGLLP